MRHQRLAAAVMTAGALAGTSAVATAATSSSTAWVATHTAAIHLRAPSLGAAPATDHLTVSVTLPLRNKAAMQELIQQQTTPGSARYHKYLTPAQVASRFGPSRSQVGAVTSYLRSTGFRDITVEPNRLLVDANATVAQAERAFHTSLALYRLNGRTVRVNTAPALVPAALRGDVLAVLGLSNLPMTHLLRTVAAASPDLTGFTARAVAHAYDADHLPAASKTSIALIIGGDPSPIIKNLRTAEDVWHFPRVPVTTVYGATKDLDTNDDAAMTGSVEWDLDTQISTMVAGSVKRLYLYDVATFTDPEVARGINLFVAQDKALNLSASLGECDYIAFLDGAMVTTDQSLMEGAAQGQSAFASTGDNGFACPEVISTGAPEGPPGVSWPSSGEYTTAVGGTTLLADDKGDVQNEIAWIATGGGVSPWETAAPWTLHANALGQTWQETNQGGRGVPDVAALADSNTPYLVFAGSTTPEGVGGTSVSSPLVMGLWTRIQNVDHDNLGLASADFYRLYNKVNPGETVSDDLTAYAPAPAPKPVPGFRDITVGSNGLYPATAGYDYTTGIGALDAGKLAKLL